MSDPFSTPDKADWKSVLRHTAVPVLAGFGLEGLRSAWDYFTTIQGTNINPKALVASVAIGIASGVIRFLSRYTTTTTPPSLPN